MTRRRRFSEKALRTCLHCGRPFVSQHGDPKQKLCSRACSFARRRAISAQTLISRFWAKVEIVDAASCWNWSGAVSPRGYGNWNASGRWVNAHRFAFEAHYGAPIPKGMLVCHECDNRLCCNPAHLWLGSAADNTADMISKGRAKHQGGANV